MSDSDALIQKMIAEGIDISTFREKPNLYQNCPFCSRTISNNIKPLLLQCGHIICQKCYNGNVRHCAVTQKQPQFKVKLNPFNSLLKYIEKGSIIQEEKMYDFGIKNTDEHFIKNLLSIPASTTWQALLTQSDKFVTFYNLKKDEATQVTINGKCYMYRDIKEKTIKELGEKGQNPVKYRDDISNQVMFHDIYRGG